VFATVNRPGVVAGQSTLVANLGFDQYFNPAAFAIPGTVTKALGAPVQLFGHAGRSILGAPGRAMWMRPYSRIFAFANSSRWAMPLSANCPVRKQWDIRSNSG